MNTLVLCHGRRHGHLQGIVPRKNVITLDEDRHCKPDIIADVETYDGFGDVRFDRIIIPHGPRSLLYWSCHRLNKKLWAKLDKWLKPGGKLFITDHKESVRTVARKSTFQHVPFYDLKRGIYTKLHCFMRKGDFEWRFRYLPLPLRPVIVDG